MTGTTPMNDWPAFFATAASTYDQEVFTRDTERETAFLLETLKLQPGQKVLDIGCGTGRHAIALARQGIHVTGLDLSPHMLARARQKALEAGVTIRFIEADAGTWKPDDTFDAVISLCEGAFCLLGRDDSPFKRDMAILFMMAQALAPGAPFLITVLNGYRFIRAATPQQVASGMINLFDMTEISTSDSVGGEIPAGLNLRERYYTGPELVRMINHSNLTVDHFWGGTAGNWRRDLPDLDEMELMVVGRRKKS